MLVSQMAAAAAAADEATKAGAEGAAADPADFDATFTEAGPLGIVWSGTLDDVELGYAYIKSVKPGGQASRNEDLQPGLILGYVDGKYCKEMGAWTRPLFWTKPLP